MPKVIEVELPDVIVERIGRLVRDGVYIDEAVALRKAAVSYFEEMPHDPGAAGLGEFVRAYRRGEIGPSLEADERIEKIVRQIRERGGLPFESVEDAMDYTRRRSLDIIQKYDELIYDDPAG